MSSTYTDEEVTWLNGQVHAIANRVAGNRRFQGYVERDDVAHALWEWLLRHENKVRGWQAGDPIDATAPILTKVLTDEGRVLARKEKAAAGGGSPEDDFFYTAGMLRELLPTVLGPREAWITAPMPDGVRRRGSRPLNEGNNWLTTLADVSRAFSRLRPADQEVLRSFYLEKRSKREVAADEDLSVRGIEHREQRALKRLWNELGGPKWLAPSEKHTHNPVVGRRKAMSNAAARALTDSQWGDA